MPYIGNTTSDFSIDTGNITNRAVTATKLSPSSVGSNGQVLSVDGSGNLQWSTDSALTLIDEDNMSSNSASSVPSQQSVKAYADTKAVLTGSTNNTIATVTGANAIQGEANLTFDGTNLGINQSSPSDLLEIHPASNNDGITIKDTGAVYPAITFDINRTGADEFLGNIRGMWNGTAVANIIFETGSDTTNKDDGLISFRTASAGSPAERLRIANNGNILLNTTVNNGANLVVNQGATNSLATSGNMNSGFFLGMSGSGSDALNIGTDGTNVWYNAAYANNAGVARGHAFYTGGNQKLLIASTGQILYQAASGDNTITSKRTNAAGSNGNYFFHFKAQDNNANDVGSFGFHRHSAVDNSRFVIHTRNAGGSNDERLRIDSAGYIGIGVTNSAHRLSIKDTNATNSTVVIDNPIASSALSGNTAANGYGHALCLENSETTTGNIVSLGFQIRTSSAYSNGAITAKAVDTSGNTQLSFWTESGNAIGERLRIAPDGDLSISDSGAVHGVAKITVIPTNRTSAFSASDGDTWHDLVLHQGGSATHNAVGIAFQLKNDGSYHKNAGTGIAAVKNGTNSDYGSDLVFITRGQSTAATEKARILSSGGITFNGDTAAENALDDYEEGNLTWYLRKSGSTSTGNDSASNVKYTKIGRMVHISGRVRTDSTPSDANDNFYLSGTLPFTPSTSGTSVVGHWRSQDQLDSSLTASVAWLSGSTTIYLYTIDSKADYNAASNNVPVSHQTNLVMTFSLTYQST